MDNLIHIVAAVVDTKKLRLYFGNGESLDILQGDTRLVPILDAITEPIAENGEAFIEPDLLKYESVGVFSNFEKIAQGVIKFYMVHKEEIDELFQNIVSNTEQPSPENTVNPQVIGEIPSGPITPVTPGSNYQTAISEIMKNAVSSSDPKFVTPAKDEATTIIAAVQSETKNGDVVIVPGMEHLTAQLNHAVKLGSVTGATNFIKRISKVITKRKHSIDELLNFMEKADLPIADDGSIVAYKMLCKTKEEGVFVDPYTRSVKQKIGSIVMQKNVDEDRRTECSTGLHIARRDYLKSFSGDTIVIAKIDPEDVIAVPLNEPSKMRTRSYLLLYQVSQEEFNNLKSGRGLQTGIGKQALGEIIQGSHTEALQKVIIKGNRGTNIDYVDLVQTTKKKKKKTKPAPKSDIIKTDTDEKTEGEKANPKEISDKVSAVKTNDPKDLYQNKRWEELYALKKRRKKSWKSLGFTVKETAVIEKNNPNKK